MRCKMLLTKRILISFLFLFTYNLHAQENNINQSLSMKNAFQLGLEKRGLEICHEILDNGTSSEKEEATYLVAEYLFTKVMTRISKKEQNVDEAKRAIYFYQKYIEEFPSGKYTKIVQLRLNFIKEVIEVDNIYGSLLNIASEEYYIVQQKFKYLFEILLKYSQPNPLKVFTESEIEQNTQQLLINYLDEIIVNYPNYELPSTYLKILVKLQLSLMN